MAIFESGMPCLMQVGVIVRGSHVSDVLYDCVHCISCQRSFRSELCQAVRQCSRPHLWHLQLIRHHHVRLRGSDCDARDTGETQCLVWDPKAKSAYGLIAQAYGYVACCHNM